MCNDIWRELIDQRLVRTVWAFVVQVWQFCNDQFWLWTFFCWVLAIFVTVFAIGITVVFEIVLVVALTVCESVCVLLNVGNRPSPPRCFDYTEHPSNSSNQGTAPTPTPALAVSAGGPYTGNIDEPISMQATISNQPLSPGNTISWDLGDGTTATGANISHVYTSPLVFTVTVSVLGQTLVGTGPIATGSTTARIIAQGGLAPPTIG
jgi:hypothetical protein